MNFAMIKELRFSTVGRSLHKISFTITETTVFNTEMTTTPEPQPCLLTKSENPDCFYLNDIDFQNKIKLFNRCAAIRSPKQIKISNRVEPLIDQRLCGVTNVSQPIYADLCFTQVDEQPQVFHYFLSINTSDPYDSELSNIQSTTFLTKKLNLEEEVS